MSRSKSKPQKPSECIQKCPACGSKALYRMEVDVLCLKCDWLSCEMHVEAGGMDNIFSAYIDHFYGSPPTVIANLASSSEDTSNHPKFTPETVKTEEMEALSA